MLWRDARTLGIAAALMVTFVFSGLWHGVYLHFVVWGTLHGVFLAGSVMLKPWKNRFYELVRLKKHPVRRFIQVFVTFNLVTFAWIFFRANSLADAWYVVSHLFSTASTHVSPFAAEQTGIASVLSPVLMEKGLRSFAFMLVSIGLMVLGNVVRKRIRIQAQPLWIRWSAYYALVLALIYLAVYNDVGFVYFQF
jgi:D-alanyl-lipoteichoic acid acyltransferase DltB (MBOAT superfamily)